MFSCFRVVMPCCFILELLKYTYILITLKSSKIIRWTREGLEGLGKSSGEQLLLQSLCHRSPWRLIASVWASVSKGQGGLFGLAHLGPNRQICRGEAACPMSASNVFILQFNVCKYLSVKDTKCGNGPYANVHSEHGVISVDSQRPIQMVIFISLKNYFQACFPKAQSHGTRVGPGTFFIRGGQLPGFVFWSPNTLTSFHALMLIIVFLDDMWAEANAVLLNLSLLSD